MKTHAVRGAAVAFALLTATLLNAPPAVAQLNGMQARTDGAAAIHRTQPAKGKDNPTRAFSAATIHDAQVVVLPDEARERLLARSGRDTAAVTKLAASSTTLLSDGFEGSWPVSPWELWHPSSGAAAVDWGKSSYRRASGSYSIWCAGSGSQSPGAGGAVPTNTNAWAIAGPFDLSAATSGTLSFDAWISTENNYDYFMWLASFDGQNYSGLQTSASTSGFQRFDQDLTDWGSAGDVTGHAQVWIAFIYQSDSSNSYEGVYVDNVALSVDAGGSSCGTYVLTDDNDNNSFSGTADGDWHYCLYNNDAKHPIEFHFDIDETSASTAQLLLLCNDVDEDTNPSNPEVDEVFINNTYLGTLTGADDQDSTTLFNVPVNALLIGRNTVTIEVNQNPGSAPDDWCVEVKQAQLIIDGGCAGSTSCRYVNTDRASYSAGDSVVISYEIDTTRSSQAVRVESNILDPSNMIVAGTERNYTLNGSSNEPQSVTLGLPSSATSGTYTVELLVFDSQTGQLDTSCSTTISVTGTSSCSLSCSASVPTTAQAGVPVSFQATASTSGCSGAPDFFWFPDTTTTATINAQNATVTYDTPGTYSWQLVVVVDNERCERNGTITVTSGGGGCTLNCSASAPSSAPVNTTVSFSASATASNCSGTVVYAWDFGDFTAGSSLQNPTHVYTATGTYNWQMTSVVNGVYCTRSGTITITGGGGTSCAYSYWVAVASHAPGSNNSQWRTDLGILNRGSGTATVEVRFNSPSGVITRTVTVAAGAQIILTDVVNWVAPGLVASGSVEICSDQPLSVSSRTYNQLPVSDPCFPNGTFGQFISSLAGTTGLAAGGQAWLPQLVENAFYRTNIGLMNMGATNAKVRIKLYNGSGALLVTYTTVLTPGQWTQESQPFFTRAGQTQMSAGWALIEVVSGSGVIAYASLVDNLTNDATTIMMVY